MTRVTNFGRKRTHLEAGVSGSQTAELDNRLGPSPIPDTSDPGPNEASTSALTLDDLLPSKCQAEEGGTDEPPKKKRKKRVRTPMSKRDGYAAKLKAGTEGKNGDRGGVEGAAAMLGGDTRDGGALEEGEQAKPTSVKKSGAQKKNRKKDRKERIKNATEARRLKRIQDKRVDTICFACRQKGHAARDCPKGRSSTEKGTAGVGICYRCGSTKHSLSKCRKPSDSSDPYPYASCFVCSGTGHLASACPQNAERGIYPNGGCCKLCGDKTHLAKDCAVKQRANDLSTIIIGSNIHSSGSAAADEDDFHILKRTANELDQAEKQHERVKRARAMEERRGVVSGTVVGGSAPKPSAVTSKKAKVVLFK